MVQRIKSIIIYAFGVYLIFFSACTMQHGNEDEWKPNILWIIADDLGADLGCYGTPHVKTSNLDDLASKGVLYQNLFTVTAVCSPSRSALITGMYPVSIDCHQHRTYAKKPLPPGMVPITEYFRDAGYFVSNGTIRDRSRPGKQDYNFVAENMYDGTDWSQRKPGEPFFSQIQIFGTHREFNRDPSNPVNPDSITLPPYYPDHPLARQDWALYLENIQLVDRQVGEILNRLEQDGLMDSTIIFFFGDQGRPHVRAKQFLYDAGIHTPLIIRWPDDINREKLNQDMISNIDLPVASMALAGIEIPDYIQGKNFLDTEERKRDFIVTMRDRRDETVDRIRSVRTDQYKYIRNSYPERPYTQFNAYKKYQYPVLTLMQVMHKNGELTPLQSRFMSADRPDEELYDIKKDPFEINNLASNPEYADVLSELRIILDDWLLEADKGTYPEDPDEIAYWDSTMAERFKKNMSSRGLQPNISDEKFLDYWIEYLRPTQDLK